MHIRKLISVAIACAVLLLACSQEPATMENFTTYQSDVSAKEFDRALERLTDSLVSLPGVTGVAESECDLQPCIKVMLEKETPELMQKIPPTYDGYRVVVEVTGEIRPQS